MSGTTVGPSSLHTGSSFPPVFRHVSARFLDSAKAGFQASPSPRTGKWFTAAAMHAGKWELEDISQFYSGLTSTEDFIV